MNWENLTGKQKAISFMISISDLFLDEDGIYKQSDLPGTEEYEACKKASETYEKYKHDLRVKWRDFFLGNNKFTINVGSA